MGRELFHLDLNGARNNSCLQK